MTKTRLFLRISSMLPFSFNILLTVTNTFSDEDTKVETKSSEQPPQVEQTSASTVPDTEAKSETASAESAPPPHHHHHLRNLPTLNNSLRHKLRRPKLRRPNSSINQHLTIHSHSKYQINLLQVSCISNTRNKGGTSSLSSPNTNNHRSHRNPIGCLHHL